jgi:hypothetical protein
MTFGGIRIEFILIKYMDGCLAEQEPVIHPKNYGFIHAGTVHFRHDIVCLGVNERPDNLFRKVAIADIQIVSFAVHHRKTPLGASNVIALNCPDGNQMSVNIDNHTIAPLPVD